jgi:Xaa-Pro dipeptidase
MLRSLGAKGRKLGIETNSYGLTHFNGKAVDEALAVSARLKEATDLINMIRASSSRLPS